MADRNPWDDFSTPVAAQAVPAQPGTPTLTQVAGPTQPLPTQDRPGEADLRQAQVHHQQLENTQLEQQLGIGPAAEVPGDLSQHGEDWLRSAPPAVQALGPQLRALSEGRQPYPSSFAMARPYWQRMVQYLSQYDPSADSNTAAERRAAITGFTGNGLAAQRVGSGNRVAAHLSDMERASQELFGPNLGQTTINSLVAGVGQSFQPVALKTYNTALGHVSQELQRYFRQGSGSQADIDRDIANLSPSASREEREAAIHEIISLIGGGLQPMMDQYNSAFRDGSSRPRIPWLNARAIETFQRIGGLDLTIPGLVPVGTPAGAPPVAGGPQSPVGGQPPTAGGGPGAPAAPSAGGPGAAIVAASSDTPPTEAVTPDYAAKAQQVQAMFNQGATRDQINAWATSHGLAPYGPDLDAAIRYRDNGGRGARILPPETMTPAGERAAQLRLIEGAAGYGHRARQGFTQGLNDEISGVASSVGNVISSPFTGNFDPIGQYQVGRDGERIRDTEAQDNTGALGTAVEVGSGIIGAAPAFVASAPAEAGMGARMLSGARTGAAFGAGSGWAHGEGPGGSAVGALEGAAGGAALGAAAPVAGAVVRAGGRAVRGAYRTVLGNNPDLSRRIVAQAIQADDASGFNPVARVSGQLADAHANDVPAMLADTGDNARGLLAASARAPGPARTAARDALDARQAGAADRVTGAIERDLGPVSNPHEVADQLMTQARDTAGPLYDSAYAAPGADTFAQRVAPLLSRPSMQRALQRASRIAAEEGRDPSTAGFDVNSSGEVTVSRTPSWQTLDYVKRGLDDVIEQYRDPTSGRLNLDTEGRAINNTQRSFLQAFDRANPDYAAARAAYGGPVRGIDAMNAGRQAINMTGDDLEARMRDMTPYERQMFQLGVRRSMAEVVASKGDSADVVNALVGTGKKRAMLARLFGDRQSFQRFVDTLGHEQEAFRTFKTARLGSPTAANLQDDNALRDAATEGATDLALSGGTHILPSALKFVTRLGRNRLDDNTAQQVTALLSESDPARLRELASELRQEQTRQAVAAARRARNARAGGVAAGETVGRNQGR